MTSNQLLEYLHLVTAFVFSAAVIGAHANTLAARRTSSWAERAALFESNLRLAMIFELAGLLAAGMAGNVLAMKLGYRMADTPLFRVANGLWLLALVVAVGVERPAAAKLAALARGAVSTGAEPGAFKATLRRWRLANGIVLALFLTLLYFMVSPWR